MSGTSTEKPQGRGRRRGGQRRRGAKAPSEALAALKLEAARELGLLEKATEVGWGNLSAAEAGRIGGYMIRLRREAQKAQ